MAYSWLGINSLFCLMLGGASMVCPLCARAPSVPNNALQVGGFGSSLPVIQWFSTAFRCVWLPISASEQRAFTFSSFVCLFSFRLSLHAQCAFLLCFWPPFCIFAFLLFLFLCPFPSVFISVDFSLLLIRCSSAALFIPSHYLPCCHFCLLCFLIFFYLSCLHGGLTDTHGATHTHTACRNTVIHTQTHNQTLETGLRGDSQLYSPTRT